MAADLATTLRKYLSDRSAPYAHFMEALAAKKPRPIVLQNLPGSTLAYVAATAALAKRTPLLIVTSGGDSAEELAGDLEFFGVPTAHYYPRWEILPYDEDELSIEVTARQLDTYDAIATTARGGAPFAICAPVDALLHRVLPKQVLDRLTVRIEWGDRVDTMKLAEQLVDAGYAREGLVEARGEFSIRGNIVDIYPVNFDHPIRLDLFGDEVESIRSFDVATQRSRETLGTETRLAFLPVALKAQMTKLRRSGGALVSFFELLPAETMVILDSPERFRETISHLHQAVDRQFHEVLKASEDVPKPDELVLYEADFERDLSRFQRIEHSLLPVETGTGTVRIPFETRGIHTGSGDLDVWISALRKEVNSERLLAVVCDNDGQVQRFDEILRENEIPAETQFAAGPKVDVSRVHDPLKGTHAAILMVGGLSAGFSLPDVRVSLLTDREIFGRYKRRTIYKKIYKGRPLVGAADIVRGDFVVHVEHGIGKFQGMRQQTIDGRTVELLEILYAENDKLLVPVEKIRYVQKYSSPESTDVTLDRLGSGKWAKRRKKSSEEIQKIADELLRLYAKREVAQRREYGDDTPLMREFEASFLYQETPDQIAAIRAVKADMESGKPMDRLVCGDVGYGKTEVAIRAIFKCVQAGRQAAVLCPTTILAQQHYNTMRERFADYNLRVEVVSRFRSPKEVKETLKKLRAGEVHVLVGTHRLLGADVQFLDLGLVVVDEEQRFGVKAKEKLKEMRADVDFLTLSATPIPRTLHMALSGIRDLSLIATPPPDRHPIKTRVIHFEEEQIAEALLRELNRGGQVYFVHNRVANIHEIANRLQEIVPHARIAVAHGQMDENDLEEVMMKFVDHQYDIMVSTTIIETGLDIPNCNTIVINRADAFGLSQLYQLRGRVGREKRRAYAFLIVPPGEAMTDTAVKRLAAIEEFTELGSGFNVAMRDLEIRGTGNLLGKEQSGTIREIGFELYCQMLEESVAKLRGDEIVEDRDIEIRAEVSSFIPQPYMPVESQRVLFYKRLAVARDERDVREIEDELRDRFGALPEPVHALVVLARTRIAATPLRLGSIQVKAGRVKLGFVPAEANAWAEDLRTRERVKKDIGAVTVVNANDVAFSFKATLAPMAQLEAVLGLLKELNAANSQAR